MPETMKYNALKAGLATVLVWAFAAAGCAPEATEPTAVAAPAAPAAAEHGDMAWWRQARYGMFVHFGPFSQKYDREIAKTQSNTPPAGGSREQTNRWLTEGLTPTRENVRAWARIARAAGMKYVVFTAKHHEGFVLWDTRRTDFNAMRMGPRFDMVAEYVKACREEGLKVGIYYSLFDADNPDCRAAQYDEACRGRLLEFTRGMLTELLTRYGRVDVLWYDGPMPMGYAGEWDAQALNTMVRRLQPGILINDRSMRAEDFTCPEGSIHMTDQPGKDWEACIPIRTGDTLWRLWGWYPGPPEKFHSARSVIEMLRTCTAGAGNLLLNVGPDPATGRIGPVEQMRLAVVGQWLKVHGEAVYGDVDRIEALEAVSNDAGGKWTRKGNTAYLWLPTWPAGGKVVLENLHAKVKSAGVLTTGQGLAVETVAIPDGPRRKNASRVTLSGLPSQCPDAVCGYAVLKIEFASYPR